MECPNQGVGPLTNKMWFYRIMVKFQWTPKMNNQNVLTEA